MVAADHAVDAVFSDGELELAEGQAAQHLVFQAVDVPVVGVVWPPQVGHAVLVERDDVAVGFGMVERGVDVLPDGHAVVFGQVGVADAEAHDGAAVTGVIGQLHAR